MTPFNPHRGVIEIKGRIDGPQAPAFVNLALDTGATITIVRPSILVAAGYDPALAKRRIAITTATEVEFPALIRLEKFSVLGQERADFPVLAHATPPSAGLDGLLGLDFLRGLSLTIDFRSGQISLS